MWNIINPFASCCPANRSNEADKAESVAALDSGRPPSAIEPPQIPLSRIHAAASYASYSTAERLAQSPCYGPRQSQTPTAAQVPSSKPLTTAQYSLLHSQFGKLSITREEKTVDSKHVSFALRLGEYESFRHNMVVIDKDEIHGGKSTLGYSDIEMSEELQGKGISYAYHQAAAKAAQELGVDLFVIDNVVSPAMESACFGMQMTESPGLWGYYEASPSKIIESTEAKLGEKRWTLQPSLQP